MKIDSVATHQPISQRADITTQAKAYDATRPEASASFAASMKAAETAPASAAGSRPTKDTVQVDFTHMTRQEMFDWMNSQIRNGNMSLASSTPFLAMTIKISEATYQPVDMATDTTRINFIEKARLGIEGALSRNDQALAERLEAAMKVMREHQHIKVHA